MVERHSSWQAWVESTVRGTLQAARPHQHKNLDDLCKQYAICREAKIISAIEGNPAINKAFENAVSMPTPADHKTQFVLMYREASENDFYQRQTPYADFAHEHEIAFNAFF